ncbi:MAG: ATP-binding cassette domain-containing protein [Lautropia sp.]
MTKRRVAAALVVAALAVAPALLSPFYVTLLNYIGLYSLVALGLLLLTGVAGQISFGQAAFVGVGAYTTAVLTTQYGLSPWLTLPIALLLVGLTAWLIGLITLRMSGHYLPLGTIAWGISLYYLFGNVPIFGGFGGIAQVPSLSFAGIDLRDSSRFYYLIWAVTLLALWAVANLLDSRLGRAIRALKGRAAMAEAFGVTPASLRIQVFVCAALLAGLSGWLFAHLQRFINPTPFSINMGIEYLFMAVVGGAGSVWGAVIGAFGITVLKEMLQATLPRLIGQAGPFELIVFGLLIVVLLQRARDGLWPALARWLPARVPAAVADTVAAPAAGAAGNATAGRSAVGPAALSAGAPPLPADPSLPADVPLLAVDAVSKRFGGLVAVDRVSFTMRRGEILGLIGPNGAGKSTLFNLISGYAPSSGGEIRFAGERISGRSADDIARLGIARTFQHVKLISAMSVLDNVAIGAHLRGRAGMVATALRLDRAEEAALLRASALQIRRVGLEAQQHAPAGSLALGQQRVVEIARALAAEPTLLLLDEPAAGLRYREKQELAALLRTLRGQGMSILLVEHDMDFVMGLTDRLVVLQFGEKLAEGPPREVQRNPAVLEAYLGT